MLNRTFILKDKDTNVGFNPAYKRKMNMNWIDELKQSPKSWQEDFSHENGNYFNLCVICDCQFIGHKRRVVCRKCSDEPIKEDNQ